MQKSIFIIFAFLLANALFWPSEALAASGKPKSIKPAQQAKSTITVQNYSLRYRVFWGGVEAAEMEFSVSESKSDFDATFNFRTKGFVNKLWKFVITGETHGIFNSQIPSTRVYAANSRLRGKEKRYSWSYDPKNKLARTIDDPSIENIIGDDLRRDVTDPLGGIMQLRAMIRGAKNKSDLKSLTGQKIPVFDGRKRFDLMIQSVGGHDEKLGDKNYSLIDLGMSVVPIAGFKERDSDNWKASKITMSVADDGMYFPVKIQIDTDWATAVIRLSGGCIGKNCVQTGL